MSQYQQLRPAINNTKSYKTTDYKKEGKNEIFTNNL